MRWLLLGLALLALAACTTLRPLSGAPAQLRREMAAGTLLKAGDRVEVVTIDGRAHELVISRVTSSELVARSESVPIDQIVTISRRELDVGPTTAVVGGVGLLILGSLVAVANSHHHPSCNGNGYFCVGP